MALQGCYACIKYLVIIFNFLFWLAGIGVLSLSIYIYVKGNIYSGGSAEMKTLFTSLYILMAAGSLMTILGFLGCCGALRESQCMLGSFFLLVLIILIAEIVAGVWAVLNQKKVEEVLTKEFKHFLQDEYGINGVANKSIDAIQHDFKCCGANEPSDWRDSNFNKQSSDGILGEIESAVSKTGAFYRVPSSCCADGSICSNLKLTSIIPTGVYQDGCVKKIEEFLKDKLTIIAGVGIGLGVIQILGLIFSIVLCCAIRNGEGASYHV